jgi:hypothetical protein
MCDKGKNGSQYFNKSIGEEGKYVYTLKNMEQYMKVSLLAHLRIREQKNSHQKDISKAILCQT